jgi:hypothetical protein
MCFHLSILQTLKFCTHDSFSVTFPPLTLVFFYSDLMKEVWYSLCQVTVHYIPIIDLIIFFISERIISLENGGCVVITSHVVFKNNQ